MKILVLAGYFLVLVALAYAELPRRSTDDDDSNDNDSEEFNVTTFSDTDLMYVYDDDGNLVQLDLEATDDAKEDRFPSKNYPEVPLIQLRHWSVEETASRISQLVFFHLYTPEKPKTDVEIYVNDNVTLSTSGFNASRPTRFITHGWVNSHKSDACSLVRDAYLAIGDYNVIVVDWSIISQYPYLYASNRVKIIGAYVAQMLNFLERQGADLSETVLVGHSLGAHVVGLAGYHATNVVGYIVGLDPALPLFCVSTSGSRIAKGDAKHVQIIHTNAGLLGYYSAIGDSDFYPNGGSFQRGCILDIGGSCSHSRAYKYFAESISTNTGFYARSCDTFWNYKRGSCSSNRLGLMGGSEPFNSVSGVYYLMTNGDSPYAMG